MTNESSRRLPHSRAFASALLTLCLLGGVAAAGQQEKPLDARLLDLDGERVKLSDLRGGPVLLELWASWCLPCRRQAEVIEGLAAEFEGRGIAVYAVNVGEERETVDEHLEHQPKATEVLLDRLQTISTRLAIDELPALVLLTADGRVAATAVGLSEREEVLAMLDRYDTHDKPQPDATHANER